MLNVLYFIKFSDHIRLALSKNYKMIKKNVYKNIINCKNYKKTKKMNIKILLIEHDKNVKLYTRFNINNMKSIKYTIKINDFGMN